MIHRVDATMTRFSCDACGESERLYETHGPDGRAHQPDYPEGWKTWPEFGLPSEEPTLLLCPEHAGLIPVVRLVEKLIRVADPVALDDGQNR